MNRRDFLKVVGIVRGPLPVSRNPSDELRIRASD